MMSKLPYVDHVLLVELHVGAGLRLDTAPRKVFGHATAKKWQADEHGNTAEFRKREARIGGIKLGLVFLWVPRSKSKSSPSRGYPPEPPVTVGKSRLRSALLPLPRRFASYPSGFSIGM